MIFFGALTLKKIELHVIVIREMNPRPLVQEPTILQQLLFFPDKDEVPSDGRIRFKKPTGSKRDKSGNDDLPESEESKEKKKKKKDKKAEKNLLSFQDEEDDE